MDIVPLCLYTSQDSKTSFLNYPSKVRIENNTKISCLEKYGYTCYTFFVINPDFRPIPTGTNLLSFKNGNSQTISIEKVYDPFNISEKTYRFISWLEPTPYCIPIFIFKSNSDNQLYFSLKNAKPNGYNINKDIKIMYVLPSNNYFFENYQGRCIPSTTSNLTLRQCLVKDNTISKDVSIITTLSPKKDTNLITNNIIVFTILVIIILIFYFLRNK
jgi:hypothetical protein